MRRFLLGAIIAFVGVPITQQLIELSDIAIEYVKSKIGVKIVENQNQMEQAKADIDSQSTTQAIGFKYEEEDDLEDDE